MNGTRTDSNDTPPRTDWKAIPGYEGYYECTSDGRVRSVDRLVPMPVNQWNPKGRANRAQSRELAQQTQKTGYRAVKLAVNGVFKSHRVHRIVMLTHGPEMPEGSTLVLHGNGNPSDNRIENLRWGTTTENMHDMVSHGTSSSQQKNACPKGHPYDLLDSRGRRSCRTCRAESSRMFYEKKKAARAASRRAEAHEGDNTSQDSETGATS